MTARNWPKPIKKSQNMTATEVQKFWDDLNHPFKPAGECYGRSPAMGVLGELIKYEIYLLISAGVLEVKPVIVELCGPMGRCEPIEVMARNYDSTRQLPPLLEVADRC